MKKKDIAKQEPKMARRRFMTSAGAGVVAAGAAIVVANNPQAAKAAEEVATENSQKGYQLSEHVKTYYRTLLV